MSPRWRAAGLSPPLLFAAGAPSKGNLPADLASFKPPINGHAIEVRICAEDPTHNYRPCTGAPAFSSTASWQPRVL